MRAPPTSAPGSSPVRGWRLAEFGSDATDARTADDCTDGNDHTRFSGAGEDGSVMRHGGEGHQPGPHIAASHRN
jgi:hypothetical protein